MESETLTQHGGKKHLHTHNYLAKSEKGLWQGKVGERDSKRGNAVWHYRLAREPKALGDKESCSGNGGGPNPANCA